MRGKPFPKGHTINSGKKLSSEHREKVIKTLVPFPKGHTMNVGKICSSETRERIRQSNIGKRRAEKTRKANSEAGKKNWQDPEYREMIIKARKGSMAGEKHPMFGKHHSEESRKKMSKSQIGLKAGKNHPMFGKHLSEEHKKMMSGLYKGKKLSPEAIKKISGENHHMFGKHMSEETKAKISAANKGKEIPAERIRRTLTRRTPTSLEIKFQSIIEKNGLPYKFVGNGSFMIGRKNPDFININSAKIAIEVYARYYKFKHSETIEKWKQERQRVFGEYGWKIIFFDETEVNEDNILQKLKEVEICAQR